MHIANPLLHALSMIAVTMCNMLEHAHYTFYLKTNYIMELNALC